MTPTNEQMAEAQRKATFADHLLDAMKLSREFVDLSVEHLHEEVLGEIEKWGGDPYQRVIPTSPPGRSGPSDE
ncbi:MAG: hypothetical protein JST79_06505 [Acidobacteria bacterium]|nr:hypothetical protein [Acidobacteriota bacterium]